MSRAHTKTAPPVANTLEQGDFSFRNRHVLQHRQLDGRAQAHQTTPHSVRLLIVGWMDRISDGIKWPSELRELQPAKWQAAVALQEKIQKDCVDLLGEEEDLDSTEQQRDQAHREEQLRTVQLYKQLWVAPGGPRLRGPPARRRGRLRPLPGRGRHRRRQRSRRPPLD